MSLVDMAPSESSRSKVTKVAARSVASSEAESATASVVSTTSMVASAGASMPAPLAMPATVKPSRFTTTVFGTVSVVMIATDAAAPPSVDSSAVADCTPASSLSIGNRSPISPVEHTATESEAIPSSSAARSAVATVSAYPFGPVQALAPPELRITARRLPSCRIERVHRTGAACTRLPVNTPAAACSGPSLTTRARSGRPDGLSPAVTPAARNPSGAVTPALAWSVAGDSETLTVPSPRLVGRGSRRVRRPG